MADVKLGSKVEDVVSGFQGIVTAWITVSNGNTRCSVTPKTADPSVKPDAVTFDLVQLKRIGVGCEKLIQPEAKTPVGMFDKAKDRITGDTGVVVAKTVFLNGCVHFECERQDYNKEKHAETYFIVEAHRVEKIGAMPKHPVKPSGGPEKRAPKMSATGRIQGRA